MADLLKRELDLPEVQLEPGNRGEFTVWVGDAVVATKGPLGFPEEAEVVQAVRAAL